MAKFNPMCKYHPAEKMTVQDGEIHSLFIISEEGTMDGKPLYKLTGQGTGGYLFSCPRCGYCEFFLTPSELSQRQFENFFNGKDG